MRPLLNSVAGLLALGALQGAWAGKIADDLEDQFTRVAADESVSALVCMADQFPVTELDWDLHRRQVSRAERHFEVVTSLQDFAQSSQEDLVDWLQKTDRPGLKDYRPYWLTNVIRVDADEATLREIAARADVGDVYYNHKVENDRPIITPVKPGEDASRFMADGLAAIGAPEVWAMGYTGQGTLVCNIDTGVDGSHSALSSRWRGNSHPASECFHDPVQNETFPYDSGSHGTHTMGTITGMSTTTGDTTGVAFGAEWIASATIDHPGGGGIEGTIALALEAFEWAVDPDENPGTIDDVPDVISNSWGIPQGTRDQCDATYYAAIDACEAAGAAVVFAAGNEGSSGLRSPSARAASIYSTFAVGALDISDPQNPFVASFSSRGPSTCSADPILQIKPEISAPGVNTYSTIPGGGYSSSFSGTSMATPHVAGVIALMRNANPNLDVITIKQIIMDTATDIDAPGDDNNTGNGMINAHLCVLAAINGYGSIYGTVTGDGSPIPATVSIVGGTQSVQCDANGDYSLAMPGDSMYTLEFSYFGYTTQTAMVSIVGDADVQQDANLASAPTGTLSGIVYGPDAMPVPGATLTVLGTPLAPVNSDGSGFYTIDMPTGASYDIHATAGGLGEQTQNLFFGGSTTLDFNLPSDPRFSPSDPDAYGYVIYDSNDGAGAPLHVWNSISGTGTAVSLGDDAFSAVAAPFAFNFYGAAFTDLSICSNGYVVPGPSGFTTYSNTGIPGTGTPNGAIYGLWDDLNPSAGGTVYYEHRAGSGEFVVEFSQVPFYGTSDPVDFQIILMDPAMHPTDTGDAQWLIHYNSDHRSSNTTGIENAAGDDGIQYVYDGAYDVHSSEIVPGLSLLITTSVGPSGTLEGTVTEAGSGDPIPGATVSVNGADLTTNALGFYSTGLPVGNYMVDASAFGYDPASDNASISDGVTTTLDFQLNAQGTATLSGVVVDSDSNPVSGALVEVLDSPYAPVNTNASGQYAIEVLTGIEWTVRASLDFFEQSQSVTLAGPTSLDFVLPRATLSGVVSNSFLAVLPGATVEVLGSPYAPVTTNGLGEYSIEVETGINWTVHASFEGLFLSQNITLNASGTLDFVLPAAILSGVVTSSSSIPLEGATIEVLNSEIPPASTNAAGEYSMTVQDGFTLDVHASAPGEGSLTQNVTINGPTTLDFMLPTDPAFSPSPPDAYGYRIFDSNDGPGAPVYVWDSISGTGTEVILSDDSFSEQATPFSFDFYGQTFNSLSVGSNGFVVPGPNGGTDFSNDPIPTGVARGRVACIWDDLNPSAGGNIYVQDSPAHGGFVVEYNNVSYYGGGGAVTFQVILLDPSSYPTPTGDAPFLVHYNTEDRLSSTIGIEDPAGAVGVQYVFDGVYDETSSPIAGGSISLLMTTNPNGIEQGEDTFPPSIVHDNLPDSANPAGPWPVSATITDFSGVAGATLEWRVNGGAWDMVVMIPAGDVYTANIPGPLVFGDTVEYRITATDASENNNEGTSPIYSFMVVDYAQVYCQHFDDGTLGDFTVETYDPLGNTWTTADFGGDQGFTAYISYSASGQVDHAALISPVIDCSNLETVDLSFWHSLRMGYTGAVTDAWVRGSTNGVDFDQLMAEWHADNEPEEINIEGIETFDISSWAAGESTVQIMFEFYDIYDWWWYVDDVCVSGSQGQELVPPVVSISYNPGGNQATLSWNPVPGANSYDVLQSTDAYGGFALIGSTDQTTFSLPVVGEGFLVVSSSENLITGTSSFDPWRNRVKRVGQSKEDLFLSQQPPRREVVDGVVIDHYVK